MADNSSIIPDLAPSVIVKYDLKLTAIIDSYISPNFKIITMQCIIFYNIKTSKSIIGIKMLIFK